MNTDIRFIGSVNAGDEFSGLYSGVKTEAEFTCGLKWISTWPNFAPCVAPVLSFLAHYLILIIL